MNGSPMQKYNIGDDRELQQLMPLKMREINKKSKNGSKIYCETNHSFIKGWGYLLPDAYIPQEEIGVIILKRDIDKTAYSLIRVRDVPGISEWTRTWLLSPNFQRNLSQPKQNASPWDLCQWYVKETYLRGEEYKKMFPRIRYLECNLEQLNNYEFVQEMFATFGLIPTSLLQNAIGKVVNIRNDALSFLTTGTFSVDKDISYPLSSDKTYEFAALWLANPPLLQEYFQAVLPLAADPKIQFELIAQLVSTGTPDGTYHPNLIFFSEWKTGYKGKEELLSRPAFKENVSKREEAAPYKDVLIVSPIL